MTEHATGVSVALVTAPDQDVAERLGRVLVEERMAACVNIVPGITSLYRWEGAVQNDTEVLLIIKTTMDGFDALRRRVLQLHPYDAPEVIDVGVRDGDPAYLEWVRDSVGESGP